MILNGKWQDNIHKIKSNSIDLIICDAPYIGVTKNKWDNVDQVNEQLSSELLRIGKKSCSLYVWCGIGELSQSLIRWLPVFKKRIKEKNKLFKLLIILFPVFKKHWYFKDMIVWKKQRGNGNKKGWLFTREECLWFVKNNKKFIWNKEHQYCEEKRAWDIVKNGKRVNKSEFKRITNVWTDIYEVGYGTCPKKYREQRKSKTPKPEKAIERMVFLHTKENDIVFEPFKDSDVVLNVCKKLNRKYIGIDNN